MNDKVKEAILKWSQKQLPKDKRKNNSPEKDFVKDLKKHLERRGFSMDVVESKATYNPKTGAYTSSAIRSGFSDMVGNDSDGRAIYIEAKARGKLNTTKNHQLDFLEEKIISGAFACVADSIEGFDFIYDTFLGLKSRKAREDFLISKLPPRKEAKGEEFFK